MIKRGDTVEVFFRKDDFRLGTVTGISHINQEVRVSLANGHKGGWYYKGKIYPALEPKQTTNANPLSSIVQQVNKENTPPGGFDEHDQLPIHLPYSFAEFKLLCKKRASGEISFPEHQEAFERLLTSQDAITTELISSHTAPQLKELAAEFGDYYAKGNTKKNNARSVYRKMLSSFLLDGTVSFAMGESYIDAVIAKVRAITQDDWDFHDVREQERQLELQESLTNPTDLLDFVKFIEHKGIDALSHEQFALWDSLHADLSRERRAENGQAKTISRFECDELADVEFTIKEGYHEKRGIPLWIVQLGTRLETDAFRELKTKAKMLGGWWSSFKKADAGFQFTSEDAAAKFTALLAGDTNREDILEARKELKELSASERLHDLANEMLKRADETIDTSNNALQNTARRADIQAGVRGQAYADQALSRTMHSVAEALSTGKAMFLDGIRHKTHLETLDTVLYLAKWARIRAIRKAENENEYGYGLRVGDEEEKPYSELDIRFASYPHPSLYRRHLEEAIACCQNKKGAKQVAAKMAKTLRQLSGEFLDFTSEHDIGQLKDFLIRAKGAGVDTEWLDRGLEKYNRLQRANIGDLHELRSALREYLPHRAEARGDDPVQIAERELIGIDISGFFPTPRPIIKQMIELADLRNGQRILEPSCGMGNILDALRETGLELAVYPIERNLTLADVLAAKGYAVDFGDFLEHRGEYDRVLMNPPFESGQDIEHVRQAHECLALGGRLVSVMSEGAFSRSDKKAADFQRWFGHLGGESYKLPDDAFKGVEAFRQTGVRTRIVIIDKD